MGMEATQILEAIRRLPLSDKIYIVELLFKDMRNAVLRMEKKDQDRRKAAELLLADYSNDGELTAFTVLDQDDFYETK